MNQDQNFRVSDQVAKKIITIKRVSVEEFQKILIDINAFIDEKNTLNLSAYYLFLIKRLIPDWKKHLNAVEEEVKVEYLSILYEYIKAIYPRLSAEVICKIYNINLYNQLTKEEQENTVQVIEEKLSLSSFTDVKKIESYLESNLIGQQEAINAITGTLKLMATDLQGHSSFFFLGQPGCGKSFCARLLGSQLKNFYQINCGEYQSGGEHHKLVGAPPGYIGYNESTILAQKAEISNRWVFLFDEVEKANNKFQEFLLNLLDEGRITDNLGQNLDFSKSIFIFTSNQGLRDSVGIRKLGFNSKESTFSESKERILESVKKHFSPEFLDRIDTTVFFNALSKEDIEKIISLELNLYPIIPSKKLINYIVENTYTSDKGARDIKKFIRQSIVPKIADQLLSIPDLNSRKLLKFDPIFKNGIPHFKSANLTSGV